MSKLPKISQNSSRNWRNNAIQFPRLIAELDFVGLLHISAVRVVADAMDCTPDEIYELVARAQTQWDAIKAAIPRPRARGVRPRGSRKTNR